MSEVLTCGKNVRQLVVLSLIVMGLVIWPEMFGNGVMTGMQKILIQSHWIKIREDLRLGNREYYGEGLGNNRPFDLRVAYRNSNLPNNRHFNLGFRCASELTN